MTDTTTRWWLIRHAPVAAGGRIYGQQDLDADASDDGAAATLAARLPDGALWLTTPLRRTHQTAAALRAHRSGTPEPRPVRELAEQHFGTWQGRTAADLAAENPEAWQRFWADPAAARPPAGESFADVVARVERVLTSWSSAHPGRDLVAVVHGGTVRAALAVALDIAPANALAFAVDTWSMTRLDRIPGAGAHGRAAWRIVTVNATPSHGVD